MGYWLKLYTDILDDPKYFKLSKEARLGMYELLLVAKKIEDGKLTGDLPSIEDIAFYTRRPVEEWQKIMPELVAVGVITDGATPSIVNYVKRQDAISNEERCKQYKKKRNETRMKRNGTESVGDKIQIREDIDTDKEIDVDVDDNNDPLISAFIEYSQLEPGKDAALIAQRLSDKGVIAVDIRKAVDYLRNNPDYKCTSFKSIKESAVIAKDQRLHPPKKKVDPEDPRRYLKGEYGDFGSH